MSQPFPYNLENDTNLKQKLIQAYSNKKNVNKRNP